MAELIIIADDLTGALDTAFDIAGKGVAVEESLLNAIEYGVKLALNL